MPRYVLHYRENRHQVEHRIEFQSACPASVLDVVARKKQGQEADLYEDDRPLCHLTNLGPEEVWLVTRFNGDRRA